MGRLSTLFLSLSLMDVSIRFLGAAQSVTGSKYLINTTTDKFLVDCGLFQGPSEMRKRNWEAYGEDPVSLDFIILTHAHIDHSGYLPRIVRQGFSGPVYVTPPTKALLEIMLLDAAKLQEEEAKWAYKKGYSVHNSPKPLFEISDAVRALRLLKEIPYDQTTDVSENISICFANAGHILGSAIVTVGLKGHTHDKKMVFSGDLGKSTQPMHLPPAKIIDADILLVESTYGDRKNENNDILEELAVIINDAITTGCLVIPSFAVGRTQQLLYFIHELAESGRIPDVPVYIDSPMAISVTYLYKEFNDDHLLTEKHKDLFDHPRYNYVRQQESSVNLNTLKKSAIIISASGMVTGGRILHHMYHRLPRRDDTILFVGYQAEGTKGRVIQEGAETVNIFGIQVPINAKVKEITGLSAHADMHDLHEWLGNFSTPPKRTFIVHGEPEASRALQNYLTSHSWPNVIIPAYLESFELFKNI